MTEIRESKTMGSGGAEAFPASLEAAISPSFENRLLATLGCTEASMLVDRLALGILTPLLITELGLTNFQVGLLASAFSMTFALSGYLGGWLADWTGRRRLLLIAAVVAFSMLSGVTGLAWSFGFLLAVRVLLGLVEGPVLSLLQSIMLRISSPGRRSFNAAFLQNVAPFVFAQFAAPIVLTHLAQSFSWRLTFFLTAVPGLILVPILFALVPSDPVPGSARAHSQLVASTSENIFRNRNFMLCVALAACTGTWIYMFITFLPLYLVRVVGYSPIEMGYATSVLGIGGCVASLFLPAISDRVGRKPVLILAFSLGLVAPVAVLALAASKALLIASILIGSCLMGITPMTITIIPSESVGRNSLARAIGLTSASSAIIGGMVMTAIAGKLSDIYGLTAPFVIATGAVLIAILLSFQLHETRFRDKP